ncbi:MAG TPA: PadR family transcriptional regulator [Acidimicrobiales bacterium]
MAVREGLLALLREGPSHGYQLKTAWETATGGVWSLNVGQVYTTLDRLARDGSVEVSEVDGQKQYAITAAGREELQAWWETGPADVPPPRDELMLKVLMAIEDGFDRALEVITDHRSALTTTLQARRRASRSATEPDLAATLVADALATRAEADLRWLDLCEARLLRARAAGNGQPDRTRGAQ